MVNEALGDDGTIRRDSPWARIVGEDFIEHAFRYAHEADPAAELYYNDFNAEVPAKRDAMVALFHRLRAAGIRIDGLGHQAHVKLGHPTVQQLEECILKFHEAGAKVMFTELDVDVLPWPGLPSMAADVKLRADYQEKFNPYADALPPKVSHQLANRYAALFRLFVKHHDKIDRVTFWGVTDADSWLNNWPIKGRANYPLLFDRRGKPKPAFGAVLKVLGE